jgi:2-keto-4-pentenoate hydratase/2-oxohepta-3-ene-1,7-dioic acid hydratase in catechol pathway
VLNYHDHVGEQNEDIPEQPLLFVELPSAVTDPGYHNIHPADIDQADFEVGLGVVIRRTARNVSG